MNKRYRLIGTISLSITITLAASGCATKKYARQQADVVNQRVSQVESKTNQKLAYLTNKEQNDISQVKEQIMTTNSKVAENTAAVQQAGATAVQALQASQANDTKIAANAA